MAISAPTLVDNLTLNLTQEIQVHASLDATFDALLEQMGPSNETPDGTPLPMTIEARPGGRWFRDLGHDNGHFWGLVQAIKRPTLLEITGPLFMSSPVVSNVQYRLKEADGGTLITFRHSAFGVVPDDQRQGLAEGWRPLLERVRKQAEVTRNAR
jgi:activator of Hsp90 ATPase-like protein